MAKQGRQRVPKVIVHANAAATRAPPPDLESLAPPLDGPSGVEALPAPSEPGAQADSPGSRTEPAPRERRNAGKDRKDADLLADAIGAFEDLELSRLETARSGVGADRRREDAFVLRNASESTPHRVAPLSPSRKGVRLPTRIVDADGRELTLLDATFSSRFAQGYAQKRFDEARAIAQRTDPDTGLRFEAQAETMRRGLLPPSGDAEADERHASALEASIAELSIYRAAVNALDVEKAAAHAEEIARLKAALADLVSFLETHREHAVPMVVLRAPLAPDGAADGSHVATVKVASEDPQRRAGWGALARPLALPVYALSAASAAVGIRFHRVDVRLDQRARATEVPITLAEGLRARGAIALNAPVRFAKDARGGRDHRRSARTVTFSRTHKQAREYARMGARPLRLLVASTESASSLGLLWASFALAAMWRTVAFPSEEMKNATIGLAGAALAAHFLLARGRAGAEATLGLKVGAFALAVFARDIGWMLAQPSVAPLVPVAAVALAVWTPLALVGAWIGASSARVAHAWSGFRAAGGKGTERESGQKSEAPAGDSPAA